VAVAAGSYGEDVVLLAKPLRIWGVCPAQVEIVGTGAEQAPVYLGGASVDGSELHGLALRGPDFGLAATGAGTVAVQGVWIHDTGGPGVVSDDVMGPMALVLEDVLIERAVDVGIGASGADVTLDGVAIRDTLPRPGSMIAGRGVNLAPNPFTGRRPTSTIARSLLERNRDTGVFVAGTDFTFTGSVVRDTLPRASDQHGGR
jgi:hypothetical protein